MNKAILIGRVTKEIERRTTPNGKSVATFTLAVNRDYKNAQGNYDADFINCVAYEQKADTISTYVHKGDKFCVIGKINTRTYDKPDGSKAYITEVIVETFEFLESKKDKPTTPTVDTDLNGFENIDIDLPFN